MRLATLTKRAPAGRRRHDAMTKDVVAMARETLHRELEADAATIPIEDFVEMYWEPIFRVGRAMGVGDSSAALTACNVLREAAQQQRGMGARRFGISTFGLVKESLAKRLVKDLARVGDGVPATLTNLLEGPLPVRTAFNTAWDEEWDRHLMGMAVERVRNQTDPRQFEIFEMYAMRRCAPAVISESYGVSAGNLYVTKHRIASRIRRELSALRAELGN